MAAGSPPTATSIKGNATPSFISTFLPSRWHSLPKRRNRGLIATPAPNGALLLHRSAILPAQSTMVTEMPEGLYQDWHPASRRQLLIVLSGTLEVETSDGKKHRCSSGEVFLADDVGTRGHRSRTIGGPACVLFVHLPPEANVGG